MNDDRFDMQELIDRKTEQDSMLTFSHFVPRLEVNPEKRYLIPPCLAKAAGSTFLMQRLERLRPHVHIFGHTHFAFDSVVDDVRYIQAALAKPQERVGGGTLIAIGAFPEINSSVP